MQSGYRYPLGTAIKNVQGGWVSGCAGAEDTGARRSVGRRAGSMRFLACINRRMQRV